MIIDTSAIMAVYLEEPDDSMYVAAILNDPMRLMSASTFFELSSADLRKMLPDPLTAIDAIIGRFRINIVPFDREQALIARIAYRRYGKGIDPLGLNLGDCFSYALSKQLNEPLLYKGNDFSRTDVLKVLPLTTNPMPLTHLNPIAFIPTANPAAARIFYEQTLGLTFASADQFALVFRVGPAQTMLRVVCAPADFTPHPFTIFGWEVDDIDATITELTGKGIEFLHFGFLEQQPNGVWLAPGGAAVAWFKDPDGNTLSLSSHPA